MSGTDLGNWNHRSDTNKPVSLAQVFRRQRYLHQLQYYADVPELVKVVTGVRGSGKSVLLAQFAAELGQRVAPDQIITVDFELPGSAGVQGSKSLIAYVQARMVPGRLYYVFLDEVQEVDDFEKAVSFLRAQGNASLFISGSGHLLSGKLAAYLDGRYAVIKVWPLSYAESLTWRGIPPEMSDQTTLNDYLSWGGLPYRFTLAADQPRRYLREALNSVVLRDVVQRTGIRDIAGLETIIEFVAENLGHVMDPELIAAFLRSQGHLLTADSVYAYLRALDAALLLNRINRFDLANKRTMSSLDKYYAVDAGLLGAKRISQGPSQAELVENCVYVELSRRGFTLLAGLTPVGGVDFIAVKDGQPRYLQTAYLLDSPEASDREFAPLAGIRDDYPKYIVTRDPFPRRRYGVHHLGLSDFLLKPPPELQ